MLRVSGAWFFLTLSLSLSLSLWRRGEEEKTRSNERELLEERKTDLARSRLGLYFSSTELALRVSQIVEEASGQQ